RAEIVEGLEPLGQAVVSVKGEYDRLVLVGHALISITAVVMRLGILCCPGRASWGRRPVVGSAGSGSATSIPSMSRPSPAALATTRTSCCAVAAPEVTPTSVVVARIVLATRGARPSTTATTTTSPPDGGAASASPA